MKTHITSIITAAALLLTPIVRGDDDGSYVSVMGRVTEGVTLYDKTTHRPFGIITSVGKGTVEVLKADSVSVGSSRVTADAVTYDRSYITSNFVIKLSK